MSNLQTYYHFKLDFQKVEQHTGAKWLIYGAKRWYEIIARNGGWGGGGLWWVNSELW